MSAIEPFHLAIAEEQLVDLNRRLDATRWPEREPVEDDSQGARLAAVQALCHYWRHDYDWRRCETMLNGFGQFRTEIDGLGIHFLHIRSPHADAIPLLLTHGWPGSVIEFHKVIGPLSDPTAHGGDRRDAFHLVIPSLPGYGFSDKPRETGWGVNRIARVWTELMRRLGYDDFVAQGGDWGASVTTALGVQRPAALRAIHLNMPCVFMRPEDLVDPTPEETKMAEATKRFFQQGSGYAAQQSTRPQTLGYGLTDSPAGQAAWIYEKLTAWSDCGGDPTNIFSFDEMIDNIMLYWLPAAGTSSARLYWESLPDRDAATVDLPTGCSMFPKEIARSSRRYIDRKYTNIVYWNELDRGGHFAAFEQPGLFTDELRACFRSLR